MVLKRIEIIVFLHTGQEVFTTEYTFSNAAPHLSNSLPNNIRLCQNIGKFKSHLIFNAKFVFFKPNALHVLGNYTIVQGAYFNG